MKKVIGALLSASLIVGTATLAFGQDKQDPQKQGKGTDGGKGDKGTGNDGKDTTKKN